MGDQSWTAGLLALSRFYVGSTTLSETLTEVAQLAVEAVDGAEFVGLTMMVEGRQRTAVFTDPESPEIDQAQYDAGEGPCVDAFQQQQVFRITSTATEIRWPAFCATARAHNIASTMSMPMVAEGRAVGAMNYYSRSEATFSDDLVALAEPFAAQAAIVLANSHAYWDARELGERITEAMQFRGVIEQAKGVLMARQSCDGDRAFAALVAASQRENIRVRDLAQRIVDDVAAPGTATPDAAA